MVTYPKDWDVVALGTKCDITSSKRVFEREWTKSGIPFLRTRDIASFHSGEEQKDKLFISENTYLEKVASSGEPHKGDLLVTGVGTIGLPYLIDTDNRIYFKDGNILWIKKSNSFVPQWLYLQFLSKEIQKQITDNSGFTTVGTFTIQNAKKLSIPKPSVSEQTAIAETLSTFDTYINDLASLIEKKRGIRDGALEDLIHGRTRLDGFNDEWNETTIGSCADILQGGTPSTANTNYWNGDIVWVTPSEITKLKGMFIGDSERKISKSGLQNSSAQILPVGAILLCSRATIGELAIAEKPMATNQGFKNLVCRDGIDNIFMAYLLLTLKEVLISKAIGTTFLEISKTALEKIKIEIPKFCEQQVIAKVLTEMDEEISALEAERDKMIKIREGAMDDLLTGRVRLSV